MTIPRDLETICPKALARRPADRYVDCRALTADLRRWLDGKRFQVRRLGVIEQTVLWARKYKSVVSWLAMVAALLILVAMVSSRTVRIWDAINGKETLSISGPLFPNGMGMHGLSKIVFCG